MIMIGNVIARLEDICYMDTLIQKDCSIELFIHFKNGEVTSTKISDRELEKLIEKLKKELCRCL